MSAERVEPLLVIPAQAGIHGKDGPRDERPSR